jgi:hypothetical protein
MKPNKENTVQDILIELEKGISYNECMALNGKKWQLAERTFVRYWNKANEQYKEVLNKRQKELNDISTEAEKERLKSALLTKHERLLIAQGIAQGKAWKSGDIKVVPSAGDRIRALDFIAKVEGDYTAVKTELDLITGAKIIIE